jgi:hypothetical protein
MEQRFLILLLWLPLLAGGCATNALWNKTQLDEWNEPASNANLRLFNASRNNDFLAVYDEYSERHDSIHTRAYFLNQNQKSVAQGQKPHFVSARLSCKLPPVPIFQTLPESNTNFSQTIYAVISTNKQSFAIYSGKEKTDYSLAVYNDGRGQIYRIALTPVAVTADFTIVGGFLGCWFIYALAESGYSVTVH